MFDWGAVISQASNAAKLPIATTAASGAAAKVDPKLASGARQFEAMMLEQMLKPLHFGSSPDMAGEEDDAGSNDTLSGFGTQAVAQALASGKGFGLASQIMRQVTAEHQARAAEQHPQPILPGGTKVP